MAGRMLILCLTVITVLVTFVNGQCSNGLTGSICNRYDYAFNKSSNQKDNYFYLNAQAANDGNINTCSNTTLTDKPWWSVDLGRNMNVEGLTIYLHQQTTNALTMYTVEVQENTPGEEGTWKMCYNTHSNTPSFPSTLQITCQNPIKGSQVQFTVQQDSFQLSLCSVGVFGTCVNGSYGNYCEHKCGQCSASASLVCDKTTGRCPGGCDIGWTGQVCDQACPFGRYGQNCAMTCGQCAFNQTCNRYTGDCNEFAGMVCDIGYKAPFCVDECDDGFYGEGCKPCGNCKFGQACNKTEGNCFNGCSPGYTSIDEYCTTECEIGRFGDNCIKDCGKCYTGTNVPGPCNNVDGSCAQGCAPGYYQDAFCLTPCQLYKWGLNCANDCGNCGGTINGTFQRVTCVATVGSCLTGCMDGWQGVSCDEECNGGFFGVSCKQTCGKCKDSAPCNRFTGVCPNSGQCEPGYLGNGCQEECPVGFYGNGCNTPCPVNCETNCSNSDGSCVCKTGWTGPNCADACRPNHYGKNCEIPCGNCLPGTTCDQGTGYCPQGCLEDWNGLRCDAEKIIEIYRRDYGPIIGGTVGGVIGLALLIAFAAWVVWRYRHDKSIQPRELASSLRRMSVRRSQQIRRSFQRLSMRGRQTDKQRLGNNSEGPAQTNGHRGRTAQNRMYDSVQIQSNTIHFDDYIRIYLQLEEGMPDGNPKLYSAFQSFLRQRPKDTTPTQNGHNQSSYYNVAVEDVQIHAEPGKSKIPEFLPLGSNLSGFLLVNTPADSDVLWNHLQQRQIETIISIGKEASFSWRPGNRVMIGQDIVDCIDVQLFGSHKETKLTVQRRGTTGRRAIRHLECFFWNQLEDLPPIGTLLMFIDRFEQLHSTQKERSILVNYKSMHDQAILFTLVASCSEILRESKRIDILRTVATGGNPTVKSVRTYDSFKYLHDLIYQYIARTGQATTI